MRWFCEPSFQEAWRLGSRFKKKVVELLACGFLVSLQLDLRLWHRQSFSTSLENLSWSEAGVSSRVPTYRHVGLAACIHCLGHRVHQVATDAKVAHFHLALSVDQYIGGLHIWRGTLLGRWWERTQQNQHWETSTGNWKLQWWHDLLITSVYHWQVTVQML